MFNDDYTIDSYYDKTFLRDKPPAKKIKHPS